VSAVFPRTAVEFDAGNPELIKLFRFSVSHAGVEDSFPVVRIISRATAATGETFHTRFTVPLEMKYYVARRVVSRTRTSVLETSVKSGKKRFLPVHKTLFRYMVSSPAESALHSFKRTIDRSIAPQPFNTAAAVVVYLIDDVSKSGTENTSLRVHGTRWTRNEFAGRKNVFRL